MFKEGSVHWGGGYLCHCWNWSYGRGHGPYPCFDTRKIVYFTENTALIMQYETSQLLLKQPPMGSAAVIVVVFSFVCVFSCSLTLFYAFTSSCSAAQLFLQKRNNYYGIKTYRSNQKGDCWGGQVKWSRECAKMFLSFGYPYEGSRWLPLNGCQHLNVTIASVFVCLSEQLHSVCCGKGCVYSAFADPLIPVWFSQLLPFVSVFIAWSCSTQVCFCTITKLTIYVDAGSSDTTWWD